MPKIWIPDIICLLEALPICCSNDSVVVAPIVPRPAGQQLNRVCLGGVSGFFPVEVKLGCEN